MIKHSLSFESIHPFIRFVHSYCINHDSQLSNQKSYDSRLIYVMDGSGKAILDGTEHNIAKGTLLLWKPGTQYTIAAAPSCPCKIIGINFDYTHRDPKNSCPISPDHASVFDYHKITEYVEFSDMDNLNKSVIIDQAGYIENSIALIKSEYSTHKNFYSSKISGLLASVLVDIARSTLSSSASAGISNDIDQIIEYIQMNFDQKLSNITIGQHFKYHPNYINMIMVRYTGTSLHQYLLNFRLSQAISLLQTTSLSIADIASQVGFKDANYFSRYYKKILGTSPDYDRLAKKQYREVSDY